MKHLNALISASAMALALAIGALAESDTLRLVGDLAPSTWRETPALQAGTTTHWQMPMLTNDKTAEHVLTLGRV